MVIVLHIGPKSAPKLALFDTTGISIVPEASPPYRPNLTVSVRLSEYRTKRAPKKLTPEQEERESRASDLIHDYARACDPGVMRALIRRLAMVRCVAAGGSDAR